MAHGPLGQVLRARLFVYGQMVALRQGLNGQGAVQPETVAV